MEGRRGANGKQPVKRNRSTSGKGRSYGVRDKKYQNKRLQSLKVTEVATLNRMTVAGDLGA